VVSASGKPVRQVTVAFIGFTSLCRLHRHLPARWPQPKSARSFKTTCLDNGFFVTCVVLQLPQEIW
jgi:hypothetical protein